VELAQRDPDFFVYGQDVGSPKGGVFGATSMLVSQFSGRAISSPLNEQLIIGAVAGASMKDARRVAPRSSLSTITSPPRRRYVWLLVSPTRAMGLDGAMIMRTKSGSGGEDPFRAAPQEGVLLGIPMLVSSGSRVFRA